MCQICFGDDIVRPATNELRFQPSETVEASDYRGEGAPVTAVTATGIAAVDALLQGNGWTGPNITFSFPTEVGQYTDYNFYGATELPSFSALSLEFREAIRLILGGGTLEGGASNFAYGSVAGLTNLSFTEVAGGEGTMRFAYSTNPTTAWGYYPWATGGEGGDAWFNPTYMGARALPAAGSYTWLTAIHELGHTLGLKHGHQTGGIINAAVPTNMDSMEYTVMTYRSYVGHNANGYVNETYGYAQTFMMLDIRALQQMYGADFTTNSGNTTYTWDPATGQMFLNGVGQGTPGANRIFLTVWDGGGIDTYDLSNYSAGATIDLTPGGHSLFSTTQQSSLGNGNLARGNVFNALQYNNDVRSLIENAIGTSGDDTIIGNQAVNVLSGGAGNDILVGGIGADTLNGGDGIDMVDYSRDGGTLGVTVNLAAGTAIDTHGSTDTLIGIERVIGSSLADTMTGDAAANNLSGRNGNDALFGGLGDDVLDGGAGDDVLVGGQGSDTLIGGDGVDTVDYGLSTAGVTVDLATGIGTWGDAQGDSYAEIENVTGSWFNDTLTGSAGANSLFGGKGLDVLNGGGGNDILVGHLDYLEAEVDTLNGGDGDDLIYGEAVDILNGGTGYDRLIAINSYDFTLDMGVSSVEYAVMDWGNDNIDARTQSQGVSVFASGGNDTVRGSIFSDLVFGGVGDDILLGGDGDDALVGEAGLDTLTGGNGNDRIYFDSDDIISGGDGFDVGYVTAGSGVSLNMEAASIEYVVDQAGGNDWFQGTFRTEAVTIFAGGGNDTAQGGSGNDLIWGEAGNDILVGGAGEDTLVGGIGADLMNGGQGRDHLYGGASDGAMDRFRFTDISVGEANWDFVYEFEQGIDKIDLSFFAGATFANVNLTVVGGSTEVSLNGQRVATVVGVTNLVASDFMMAAGGAGADGKLVAPLVQPDLTDLIDTPLVRPTVEDAKAIAGEVSIVCVAPNPFVDPALEFADVSSRDWLTRDVVRQSDYIFA